MFLENGRVGFIGGGAMAEALMGGFIRAGLVGPEQIMASDVSEGRREYLGRKLGVKTVPDNLSVVSDSDIVILSVKPFIMGEVLKEIGDHLHQNQTVISIAGGVSTGYIEQFFKERTPVVRVMPNTPALVGAGAAAVCCGRWAGDRHCEMALSLFKSVGLAVAVTENLMDAVTGISGSGPAYMYVIAEAMADAGVRAGLPRATALTLACQTMHGAARMILETGNHPGALKDMVTTPGGTTIEGLFALEEGGLRATIGNAVENACRRSRQLSGETKK
ncbi:MAG: pyrroline-5-carboxylate reductase [Firmicutes bacterium]|nr:pyrroline-5-carboxylate reductase [Bacillota bacterium]